MTKGHRNGGSTETTTAWYVVGTKGAASGSHSLKPENNEMHIFGYFC